MSELTAGRIGAVFQALVLGTALFLTLLRLIDLGVDAHIFRYTTF